MDAQIILNGNNPFSYVGGMAGRFESGTAPNDGFIRESIVKGHLLFTNNTARNSSFAIGGVAGHFRQGVMDKVISHFDVLGNIKVGGLVGEVGTGANNDTVISNVFVTGTVKFHGEGNANFGNGGLIGFVEPIMTTNFSFNNAFFDGIIDDNSLGQNCGGFLNCGVIIGGIAPPGGAGNFSCNNLTNDANYNYIGSASLAGVGSGQSGCQDSANVGTGVRNNFPTTGAFDADRNLVFVKEWKILSPSLDTVGNYWNPLEIKSVADWNLVANDNSNLLRRKSFRLMSDLTFNGNFKPWGGVGTGTGVGPFIGSIFPNGYRLINVDIDETECSGTSCGMIIELGLSGLESLVMPNIGTWDDPLVVQGLTMTVTSGKNEIGGVIGLSNQGIINARVSGGLIAGNANVGSLASVGGLVGRMRQGSVYSSSFQGQISLASSAFYPYVGGLVGTMAVDSNSGDMNIESSFAVVTFAGNSGAKGGILGQLSHINPGDLESSIRGSYAVINGFGTTGVGHSSGGIIGSYGHAGFGTFSMAETIAVINSADASQAIIGTYQPGSNYNNFDNPSISFIGDVAAHPLAAASGGANVGMAYPSYSNFLGSGTINYTMESEFIFRAIDPHPKMFWEFPDGTFPFMDDPGEY